MPLSYAATILADNPTAAWGLQEPSGAAFADLSGNGHNGSFSGGFTRNVGTPFHGVGVGVTLDGTGIGSIADSAADLDCTADFTQEFWFSTPSIATEQFMLCKASSGTIDGAALAIKASKLRFTLSFNGGDALLGVTTLLSNTWYYVAFTRAGNTETFYLNGAFESSTGSAPFTIGDTTGPELIGSLTAGGLLQLNGTIARPALYKGVALSPAQIAAHYAARNQANTTGNSTTSTTFAG